MKHFLLFTGCLLSAVATRGQTYFYIDNINIDPSSPTTADNISVDLVGGLSSTGAFVSSSSASVNGSIVTLTVNSADPGGSAVIVPHTESIAIGQLPPGTYTIAITGTATGDFAPSLEHMFVVSGGGNLAACDTLAFQEIQYAAFNDSIIEVTLSNSSSVLFDYPGFILFDDNGDTVAVETVNYFGIGQSSQLHSLVILPGVTIPAEPFVGTLELWTGFTTSLACTFPLDEPLCPTAPCAEAAVVIQNTGGALVTSTFAYVITDSMGAQVSAGSLELDNFDQQDTVNICLPPGDYTLTMDQPAPSGGQLQFGLIDLPFSATGISEPFIQGTVNTISFGFYVHCVDGGTSIIQLEDGQEMVATIDNELLSVRASSALGLLHVHDLQGRLVLEQRASGTSTTIDLRTLASGCYVLTQVHGSVRSLRFTKP